MLRARLQADLRAAMAAQDGLTTATLRVLLAVLANAEAVDADAAAPATEVARRELSDDDEQRLLDQERRELRATALMLRSCGNEQSACELEDRAAVVDRYLTG